MGRQVVLLDQQRGQAAARRVARACERSGEQTHDRASGDEGSDAGDGEHAVEIDDLGVRADPLRGGAVQALGEPRVAEAEALLRIADVGAARLGQRKGAVIALDGSAH